MPTLDINLERKILIEEIAGILKEINYTKHIIRYYWKVGQLAEKLILDVMGGERCDFPVDVEALAKKLGIAVETENLNEFQNRKIRSLNRKIGQLIIRRNSYTGEREVTIRVEKMAPPSSSRYAIANEIVHYLLHYDDEKYYENYFIMPMCPKTMEEVAADIFAVFLLIPMRQFLVEFSQFVKYEVENQNIPITTEEWIQHLSDRAVLSEYYVAYGYQYLRGIGYWVYQANNADSEQMQAIKMTKREKSDILEWVSGYYTKECEEWLFQD